MLREVKKARGSESQENRRNEGAFWFIDAEAV
jgi:hypothetical protein